jgi:integrase/recombinase XerC
MNNPGKESMISQESNISTTSDQEQFSRFDYVGPHAGQFLPGRPTPRRFFEAAPCEGPGCKNVVPAGYDSASRTRSFCSSTCRQREASNKYVIGTCPQCGGPVMGLMGTKHKKIFCCNDHMLAYETERILGATGAFRPMIEEYMATGAANNYSPGTLHTVRVSVTTFFRFATEVEGISTLEEIRPAVISRFIAFQSARGCTSRNYIGHLATLFNWLIAEERYERGNPIVSRIHHQRCAPASPRPYNEADLNTIWKCVEESGNTRLMLAFAIGEECGLRVGEVANIRLDDIDLSNQTIFVRLPTKNKRTRTVPFHEKVKKYLAAWLAERDPKCSCDNLLHNTAPNHFTGNQLDSWFKKLLSKAGEPAASFCFHRLRHTWATRLMNNGMELATLKELGGWVSLNSMQRYIRVLPETVKRQYEQAYQKLQESQALEAEESISLVDFAMMNKDNDISYVSSAV